MSDNIGVNSRRRQIYLLWRDITEIYLGPARDWPKSIRNLFWTRNLKQFQRFLIFTFVYINPLPREVFFQWVELMHLCRDRNAYEQRQNLFRAFDGRISTGHQVTVVQDGDNAVSKCNETFT